MATIASMTARLGIDTDQFQRGLRRAERNTTLFVGNMAAHLRDGSSRFRAAGRDMGRGFVRSFGTAASRVPAVLSRAFAGTGPIGAIAGAIIAGSFIAALAAGITIGVSGMAVIGLAAVLLKEEPAIKKAAGRLKKTAVDTMKSAAKPMVKPLSEALKALEGTIVDLKPQFEKMFQTIADSGALKSLTDGIDKLVKNALPGFNRMLEEAGPVFEGIERVMEGVGEGLNLFFREIAKAGPEAKIALEDLGGIIRAVLSATGQLIGFLAKLYAKVRPALKAVTEAFRWLRDRVYPVVKFVTNNVPELFKFMVDKIKGFIIRFVAGIISRFVRFGARLASTVSRNVSRVVNFFKKLPGRVWGALSTLGSKIRSRATQAGKALVRTIARNISSAVRKVKSLPGRARSALGNLAGRLKGAGRALIRGFIDGIKGMIGSVRRAAESVVGAVRDFFPSSPAKEGPFSGRGYTLYSGMALVDDFSKGIAKASPALRREVDGMMSAVPALRADVSGVVRAGRAKRDPVPVEINVTGADRHMRDLIRHIVQTEGGGNVQSALGRR